MGWSPKLRYMPPTRDKESCMSISISSTVRSAGGTFPMTEKYTLKDVDILIDAFANLAEKGIAEITAEDLIPLTNYPEEVVQTFIDCVGCIPDTMDIRKSFNALRVYIGIRLNLV